MHDLALVCRSVCCSVSWYCSLPHCIPNTTPFLFIANIQAPSYLKAFHQLSWCLECFLLPDLSKSVFGCLSTSVLPPWKIYPFIDRGLSFPIYSTPSSAQLFNIFYSKDLSLAVILWIMHLPFDNYLPSTLGRRFREVRLLTCLT